MNRYGVRVARSGTLGDLWYWIEEDYDGALVWEYDVYASYPRRDDSAVPIKRAGNMSSCLVTGEDAEAITGLYMPAAMDRLRELLHESHYVPKRPDWHESQSFSS